ncbi:MAG TPA: DUF1493 family protein [Thermohalobaculum sp.]|nr:DUF1493 family protein [Thermohalobaculum sp.]
MARQTHFERVRALVSAYAGVPEAEITPETRLYEDLGLDGDAGRAVLAAFADAFGVDLAPVAPLNYFNDQTAFTGYATLVPVAARLSPAFRARVRRAARGMRALRVRDLVASARAGQWIRPPLPRGDADLTRLGPGGAAIIAGSVALPVLLGLWQYAQLDAPPDRAAGVSLGILTLLWGLLAARFLAALPWLRRLDEAAAREEAALSAAG